MNLIKSLVPEITFCIAAIIVFFSMWSIAGFSYAALFFGAFLFVATSLVHGVMTTEEK